MASADDERYRVVRIFPDYGDSAIWFADAYPFDYDDTGLSAELRAAFEEWERYYYENINFPGVGTAESRSHHLEEGRRLAIALAKEIGPPFEVELRSDFLPLAVPRYAGGDTPTNAAAAAAFSRVRNESLADRVAFEKRKAEIEANGGRLALVPASPRSRIGRIFRPRGKPGRDR